MNAKKRILFLHGLGQGPDSWRAVAERLTGVDAVIPDLGAMLAGRADYLALRGALFAVCDAEKAPLHLCGLSLGGVLALAYAAHRPERVASRTAFESLGLTKRQMRGLSLSMATLEIPALLPRVRCRTLVLCGEKDRANRKAARQLQEGLSNAAMQTIDGAGHEANREAPEALSAALAAFYGAE